MLAANEQNTSSHGDLDFKITFPSASAGSREEMYVVFLLGWMGSQDRTLAKYSSIYEEKNCITIRYTHSVQSTFLSDPNYSPSHKAASEKLVQLLEDNDLHENPVFVHLFSNGGYFVYHYFAFELERRNIKVAGTIFDSCPADLHWNRAMKGLYYSNAVPNKLVFFFVAMFFSVTYLFLYIKSILGYEVKNLYEVMQQSATQQWPHLYLYSSADRIVPMEHIENMAEAREKAGVSLVRRHNFGTSRHVLHFKSFPDDYSKLCVDFVDDCISLLHKNTPPDHKL